VVAELTTIPVLGPAQTSGWHGLLDLYDRLPRHWTLVGGQLVHYWCAVRGRWPERATDDVDTVLDVRGEPQALLLVTGALRDLGFAADGTTPTGHQHRWRREQAIIDVLIPRHLGVRADRRTGVSGGTTIATPGAQKVIDRTGIAQVQVGERTGSIRRPSLVGALIGKAAARSVTLDRYRDRHLVDFGVLCSLLTPRDLDGEAPLDRSERGRLTWMRDEMRASRPAWAIVDGADTGLDRLDLILDED
jgi:hypothetical protein